MPPSFIIIADVKNTCAHMREWRNGEATRAAGKGAEMRVSLNLTNKRLLNREEMLLYTGMGKTAARAWCDKIGAVRHIGARTLFDKKVIDAAIDKMSEKE